MGTADSNLKGAGVKFLLRIDPFRFLLVYYGPMLLLITLGLIIRGNDIFTINNLKSVKFLGGDIYLMSFIFIYFFLYLIYITLMCIYSKGIYLKSDDVFIYKYELKVSTLENVLSIKIIHLGLYECLHIKLKEGRDVIFRITLAKKEDSDNLRKILEENYGDRCDNPK